MFFVFPSKLLPTPVALAHISHTQFATMSSYSGKPVALYFGVRYVFSKSIETFGAGLHHRVGLQPTLRHAWGRFAWE